MSLSSHKNRPQAFTHTLFSLEEPLNPEFDEVLYCSRKLSSATDDAAAWQPLVLLIGEFKHLTDLIYSCGGRFAPGLMEALHRHHPSIRLHLRNFRFKSLNSSVTDPEEHALVKSPCLYGLSTICTWRDSDGVDDFNLEATLDTVACAPNLKHVRILGARPSSSAALHRNRFREKDPWNGFKPNISTSNRGSLASLSFCGYKDLLEHSTLDLWDQYTQISKLRALSFAVSSHKLLSDIAAADRLPSLQKLSIALRCRNNDQRFKTAAEAFFRELRPLEFLHVEGNLHRELLPAICEQHGDTVRELGFRPWETGDATTESSAFIASEDILMIANSCPILTKLFVSIKRSMSDRAETACYEAIGKIRKLKTLEIFLDCCSPNGVMNPSPEQFEAALVNSAIDEALARSIWDVISESTGRVSLESLTIIGGGDSAFHNHHPGDLMTIVHHISRSYLITASVSNVNREVKVVELGRAKREMEDADQREHEETMLKRWGHRDLNGPAFKAFNRIWPLEEGYENWREAWRSKPLERGGP